MLDIIVTHYKEPWEVGKKFFDMLGLQRGVDFSSFRVLLVNDGEEYALPDLCFSDYPYTVQQISIPHGGVSAARNAGLKAATDKWVMFCDFDDMFSNVYALRNMTELLPAPDYDMLWAHLITEDLLEKNNRLLITPDDSNFVFIHGKMYRRAFLVENDIWFDEELSFNEDSAFNAVFNTIANYRRVGELKTFAPPYIWCRRNNSVTTTPGRIDAATMGHFHRNLKVCEAHKKRLTDERIRGMVTRTVYDTFYMLHSKLISPIAEKQIEKEFQQFWAENKQYYGNVDADTLKKIQTISFQELSNPKKQIYATVDTVNDWLKKMDNRVNQTV